MGHRGMRCVGFWSQTVPQQARTQVMVNQVYDDTIPRASDFTNLRGYNLLLGGVRLRQQRKKLVRCDERLIANASRQCQGEEDRVRAGTADIMYAFRRFLMAPRALFSAAPFRHGSGFKFSGVSFAQSFLHSQRSLHRFWRL